MNLNRPLRFCMLTTFYPPYSFGGDGIYVHRLSNELAKRGHYIEIIHSIEAYHLRAPEPTTARVNHPNITLHGLKSRWGLLSTLLTQQTGVPVFHAKRIRQILATGFDVINYHNVSLVGGTDVLTYGNAIKLYSLHEYWLICPTHVLFRDNRAACDAPHCLKCSLLYRRPPPWWRYTRRLRNAIQHIDRFITPSHFVADIHRQRGFDAPFVHLPYFVPPVELAPRHETDAPYFLFAGRLEKLKGVQTLIPIFQNFPKAKLLIAGRGSYKANLHALAQSHPNIEFLGQVSGTKLHELYRNAIALIMPSLCYEAFPLVMVEAFQQQTPVIARNLGAMPEMIYDSGGGLIYSTDNELVAALNQLLDDLPYRRELGQRGYAAYQKKWTADIHLQNYLALIEEIAGAKAK